MYQLYTLHTAVTTVTSLSFPMYYSSFTLCTSWMIAYCPQWDFEPNSFQMSKSYRFKKWQRVSRKAKLHGKGWFSTRFEHRWKNQQKTLFKSGWITEPQSYRFKFIRNFCFFWDLCHSWGSRWKKCWSKVPVLFLVHTTLLKLSRDQLEFHTFCIRRCLQTYLLVIHTF